MVWPGVAALVFALVLVGAICWDTYRTSVRRRR